MSTKINKSGYWQWAKFFRKAQIVIRFLSLLVSMKESFNKIVDEPSYLPVFSTSPSPCPLPSRGGGRGWMHAFNPGFARANNIPPLTGRGHLATRRKLPVAA
jgi:hypothetical protein